MTNGSTFTDVLITISGSTVRITGELGTVTGAAIHVVVTDIALLDRGVTKTFASFKTPVGMYSIVGATPAEVNAELATIRAAHPKRSCRVIMRDTGTWDLNHLIGER